MRGKVILGVAVLPLLITILHPSTLPIPHPGLPGSLGSEHPGHQYATGVVTPPASTLLTELVAYWNLDELSGTRAKTAGSCATCDLTAVNAPGAMGGGGSYSLASTTGNAVTVTDNTSLSHGDTNFSYVAWVVPTIACGSVEYFLGKADAGFSAAGSEFGLRCYGTSLDMVIASGGTLSNPAMGIANAFTTNARTMVFGYHDATNNLIGLSANAGSITSTAWTTGVNDVASSFSIGRPGDLAAVYWIGQIGPVLRYSKVLSAAEVTDIYNSGKGYTCANLPSALRTNLVACWDADEASGTRYNESYTSCGSTCDLTAVNAPPQAAGIVENGMGMSAQVISTSGQALVSPNVTLSAVTDSALTVVTWVNSRQNQTAGVGIMGQYAAASTSSAFTFYTAGATSVTGATVKGIVRTDTASTATINVGEWTMLTLRRGAGLSQVCLARNGIASETCSVASVGMNTPDAPIQVARLTAGGGYFGGALDAPGVWARRLSDTELTALFAAGTGVEYPWSSIVSLFTNPDQRWADRPRHERQFAVYSQTGVWVPAYMFPSEVN